VARHAGGDRSPDEPCVTGDVEQTTRRVVVVPDEEEARLIGARHAVRPQCEPALVDADEPVQQIERGRVAGGEDDVVEWLLAPVGEPNAVLSE
jgi:hypothetical protein